MEKVKLDHLLTGQTERQKALNDIVLNAVKEEKLISAKLADTDDCNISPGNRLADKVASFGGSWRFIGAFFAFIVLWIGSNIYLLTRPFDPYPFILLNLILSCVAAIQAPVIMMSQNRKEEKDRLRAQNDYLVNLKAEIEIRNLHQKLDMLIIEQMNSLFEIQKIQLELMEDIREVLEKTNPRQDPKH
jgi:uncharacterized membrane protein